MNSRSEGAKERGSEGVASEHPHPTQGEDSADPRSLAPSLTRSSAIWQSSRDRTKGRGLLWETLGELSSVKTAATLIACLTVVIWVAAYYERDYGMAAAQVMFYQAWWFNLIFIFMAVAVVGAVLVRLPLRRHQTGFAIVHCGLLLLIAGFWLGGAGRLDGMLNAWPGEPAHLIELPTDELDIRASHPDPAQTSDLSWRSAPFEPLAWSGHPSALRYLLQPVWPTQRPGIYVLPHPRQLAALPDGTTISATRVVDTGAAELGWGAAPGDPAAQPATRIALSLRPPMAASFQDFASTWLTPSGEGMFSRGPLTVTMARTSSVEMVADFLSTAPETATDGRLLIYFQGRKLILELDRQRLPQQLDITPELALVEATNILRKHLNPFVKYFEIGRELEGGVSDLAVEGDSEKSALLGKQISSLDLSVKTENALRAGNIKTVGDLVQMDEAEVAGVRNLGKIAAKELKKKLADRGLNFGMRLASKSAEA